MKRIKFADAAKAIALYLVIVGHTLSAKSPIFRFIFAFHMPFFFFISGYCFSDDNLRMNYKTYAKNKAVKLIIPYILFSVIGIGIMLVFDSWKPGWGTFDLIMRYVYFAEPAALGQVWFLIALLMSSLMFMAALSLTGIKQRLAENYCDSERNKKDTVIYILIMAAFAAAGAIIPQAVNVPYFGKLPWKIDTALTATVFMMAGYAARRLELFEKMRISYRVLLTILLPVVIYFTAVKWNGYVNICECKYDNVFLYYIGAMAGCVWMCLLGKWTENTEWLRWLGRNTLPVFGIHSFILWAWIRVYCKLTHIETVHLPDGIISLVVIPILAYGCSVLFVPVYNFIMRKIASAGRNKGSGKDRKC